MKILIRIMLAPVLALIITGCVDRSVPTAGPGSQPEPNILVVQPANADSVSPVVNAIHESLMQVACQSQGADIPQPQIHIVRAEGKVEAVTPSAVTGVGVGLFGQNTPKAKQGRMESQIKALAEALTAGCKGSAMSADQSRAAAATLFGAKPFVVWMAAGGASPWNTGTSPGGPVKVIADRVEFENELASLGRSGGGNVIVFPDDITEVVTQATPIPVKPVTARAEATKTGTTGTIVEATPTVMVKDRAPTPSQADRGDIIIGFNLAASTLPGQASVVAEPGRVESVLPPGVEPVGDPITFASGSAKVSPAGWETVQQIAAQLTGKDAEYEVLLVASADPKGAEGANIELSRERASAIEAALLRFGIVVERAISVGASLTPDDTPPRKRLGYRSVRIYFLRREEVADHWLSNQIASRPK